MSPEAARLKRDGLRHKATTMLTYFALALVFIWTVRMALSKGKNPWLWGGLCLGLMFVPEVKLLAAIPAVALLFTKSSREPGASVAEPELDSCPRCLVALVRDARFCTSCGWDLAEQYVPEPVPQDNLQEEQPEAVAVKDAAPEAASAPQAEAPVGAAAPISDDEPVPDPPPPPFTPTRKPVNLVPPTAAGMTERGVTMFNQGRFQESIDQFTKAIALDPTYVEAWARRAEAYAQLGRGSEADEDRRRLDALNAG